MEAWKGVLKPQQIRDVVTYLRAQFQPREGRDKP
jgi:mono/diheme cytochrome c family protein